MLKTFSVSSSKAHSTDTAPMGLFTGVVEHDRREPESAAWLGCPSTAASAPLAAANPFTFLVLTLRQLGDVLSATTDDQYVQMPVGVIPSSLGGHVRHCLDHVETLLTGVACGRMNYDKRARGTSVETIRSVALEAIARLEPRISTLDESALFRPIRVTAMLAGDGASIEAQSSVGRELAFVVSHTVHHNALVAAMCKTLGIALPERFGYAPATIVHLDKSQCAPSPSSR